MIAVERAVEVQGSQAFNLVILGPPGVGKGTQAERLAARLGIPHISSGDLFRAIIAGSSPLGNELRPFVERGEYVPDDLVVAVVQERLSAPDAACGFILDGFPRTVLQARTLDRWLADQGRALDGVLDITAPIDVLTRRMAHRRAVENRTDDNPMVFVTRLREYVLRTQPVIDYYRRRGTLIEVDGSGSIEEVAASLDAAIESLTLQHR